MCSPSLHFPACLASCDWPVFLYFFDFDLSALLRFWSSTFTAFWIKSLFVDLIPQPEFSFALRPEHIIYSKNYLRVEAACWGLLLYLKHSLVQVSEEDSRWRRKRSERGSALRSSRVELWFINRGKRADRRVYQLHPEPLHSMLPAAFTLTPSLSLHLSSSSPPLHSVWPPQGSTQPLAHINYTLLQLLLRPRGDTRYVPLYFLYTPLAVKMPSNVYNLCVSKSHWVTAGMWGGWQNTF